MLLISEAHKAHDLSSLELITYGSEPMLDCTLQALNRAFPGVRFKQTYGLSELGILPTASEDSQSLWLRMGGEGYETRVVDGILWIRTPSAMLGYLNAPSPFDAEGWFNTGDAVEIQGDYLRILGRVRERINVGGQKVYPAEVESMLLQLDNIRDVTVYGKRNAMMGSVVAATVSLFQPEDHAQVEQRLRAFCKGRLEEYKVPVIVEIEDADRPSDRFKKRRDLGRGGG